MSVEELNTDQIYSLKSNIYYALDTIPGNEELTQSDLDKINSSLSIDDIPMEIVHKLYDGICFVEEDF